MVDMACGRLGAYAGRAEDSERRISRCRLPVALGLRRRQAGGRRHVEQPGAGAAQCRSETRRAASDAQACAWAPQGAAGSRRSYRKLLTAIGSCKISPQPPHM
eukprot:5747561-Prymnesium_polylepis.2